MRVKINGKEVEVGPSKHIQRKLDTFKTLSSHSSEKQNLDDFQSAIDNFPIKNGWLKNIFQELEKQGYAQQSRLRINGREVDMNNPDDIQNAIRFCKIMGKVVMGFGIFFVLVMGSETDWGNFYFSEDILGGLFAISVWLILGTIFTFVTPKSLQKRLDELKKQGKFPSKR